MDISIVIPAYNAAQTLKPCLDACLRQRVPAREIIVVDDGSSDATAAIAESLPGIRCIRQENRGPAAARNRGARDAVGEILVFTDADCVPHEDWLEQLVSAFAEGVVGVGGTYGMANPGTLLARLVHEEILCRHGCFELEVDFLGSFNVAYRKEAFDAVGGFDESFRMASAEDNDLAYRLQDAGGRLHFVPEAVVDHFHPDRLLPYLRTQMGHGYWRVKLYRKHPGRASGDQYAGRRELLAPALALAVLISVVAFPFLPGYLAFAVLFVGAWAVLLYPQSPAALRARLPIVAKFYFGCVRFLRDVARGVGMLHGVWAFVLRRRA